MCKSLATIVIFALSIVPCYLYCVGPPPNCCPTCPDCRGSCCGYTRSSNYFSALRSRLADEIDRLELDLRRPRCTDGACERKPSNDDPLTNVDLTSELAEAIDFVKPKVLLVPKHMVEKLLTLSKEESPKGKEESVVDPPPAQVRSQKKERSVEEEQPTDRETQQDASDGSLAGMSIRRYCDFHCHCV